MKLWVEDRGLKHAAVTNAPRENAELVLSILGLAEFFDALIIGNDCEHPKPHPSPYLKALEALNMSKDHTFVFEVRNILLQKIVCFFFMKPDNWFCFHSD